MTNANHREDDASFGPLVTAAASLALERFDEMSMACHNKPRITKPKWYEIQKIRLLGQGYCSNVHLVATQQHGQMAMKSLDARRIPGPSEFVDAAADLAHEACLMSQFDHPNLVQLRGVPTTSLSESYAEHGNGYFILMDVLDGTLRQRIGEWKKTERCNHLLCLFKTPSLRHDALASMQLGRVESIAIGIARGMQYLHGMDVLLRDLKPENIGFDRDTGHVMLFDFGMAREVKSCPADEICGSLRYMAPEVMEGKGHSFQSDVYSFGMVLYELCTLRMPFANKRKATFQECKELVVSGRRPIMNEALIPSRPLRSLIAQCWDPDPTQRPQSFRSIVATLILITTIKKKTRSLSSHSIPDTSGGSSSLGPEWWSVSAERNSKTISSSSSTTRLSWSG